MNGVLMEAVTREKPSISNGRAFPEILVLLSDLIMATWLQGDFPGITWHVTSPGLGSSACASHLR